MDKCPTCGQASNRPYRNRIQGSVREGCISTFHNHAMRSDPWHNQEGAADVRRQAASHGTTA